MFKNNQNIFDVAPEIVKSKIFVPLKKEIIFTAFIQERKKVIEIVKYVF